MARLIIISAPSGTGKSTIIARLMEQYPELDLHFSISATSRAPRGTEQHGREYYFFSAEEFAQRIEASEFLEWEEVYAGKYYGTLHSEVERRLSIGQNVILDIDCVGALNVRHVYGERALAIFIIPPSLEELRRRLEGRGTDTTELIEERLAKAQQELESQGSFDHRVINDSVERCTDEVAGLIAQFIQAEA